MSIRFEDVHHSFGEREVLRGFSFEAKPSEILFILGRSGTGKSVTLKNTVGLLKPDRGKIWVDETEVTCLSEIELRAVRKKCGMVFQYPALFDSISVYENISYGLPSRHGQEPEIRRALELVHLPDSVLPLKPSQLSFGMQKRASLARTLAPRPTHLLFDEPTTGLDPVITRAIDDLVLHLSRELRVTSIVVSHDMGAALRIADRILVLDQGRVLALGTPAEIRNSSEPLIRSFLQEESS